MIPFVLRQLWRFIILLIGITLLYVIALMVWPESGSRFAVFIALLIIYCLMAYVIIPNLMRLFHVFSKPDHIPLYVTTGDGWPSDPVNIAVVTRSRGHLEKTMKQAGWYTADPNTLHNSLKEAWSIIFNQPYPTAPISALYLFNRRHDIAFQIPTNDRMSARTRHHVRFWRLEPPRHDRHDRGHFEFWSRKLQNWLHREQEMWVGASTEDFRPLDVRWRTGSLTHGVSHEADKERDFIIQTLRDQKLVKSVHVSEPGEQFKFRGQSFRTIYTTDGSLKVVRIK